MTFNICILNFTGCATAPLIVAPPKPPEGSPGIYHRVEKGQTLWRISKIYGVDLDEIIRVNHISDVTNIEVKQLIFIPRTQSQQTAPQSGRMLDDFIWPVRGKVIAMFGQTYANMINKGINIQPSANTEVVASRAGRVAFSSENFKGFGKTLIIEHSDGFSTVYARNSEIFVRAGESIQKGARIARVGSAGRDKNAYLHFEIRKGHIPKNPYFYLPR